MGKAAIINMVEWLSHELMDYNIRVNAIAPGLTKTAMIKTMIDMGVEASLPKGSMGYPEEIAAVAAMICSNSDGSFVNGETFIISGGFPHL